MHYDNLNYSAAGVSSTTGASSALIFPPCGIPSLCSVTSLTSALGSALISSLTASGFELQASSFFPTSLTTQANDCNG